MTDKKKEEPKKHEAPKPKPAPEPAKPSPKPVAVAPVTAPAASAPKVKCSVCAKEVSGFYTVSTDGRGFCSNECFAKK